jgi:hypothetical protein
MIATAYRKVQCRFTDVREIVISAASQDPTRE